MAIQKEIWIADIQEALFKDNTFIKRLTDHSAFKDNLKVHVPQAGANPAVAKNRSSLPGTITQRTDTDLEYSMNYYSSDPILLTDIDALQVNYNKRASILSSHINTIEEVITNQTLYTMAPTAQSRILRTSGSSTSNALSSGATGVRNSVTYQDILRLKAILDNDGAPKTGRILMVPSDILNNQLMNLDEVKNASIYGKGANIPDGVVARVAGFDIIDRATVCSYTTGASPTLKTVGDNGEMTGTATTDNLALLAFHPNFVSNALGSIKVFYGEDRPEYYGSIFSCAVQHGAAKLRSDSKGIAALVQI